MGDDDFKRQEFSPKTKAEAFLRDKGRCLKCRTKIMRGDAEFDHRVPCALGGDNSLKNCETLCVACHKVKTHTEDRPAINRAVRLSKKHNGEYRETKHKLQSAGFSKTHTRGLDGKVRPKR